MSRQGWIVTALIAIVVIAVAIYILASGDGGSGY